MKDGVGRDGDKHSMHHVHICIYKLTLTITGTLNFFDWGLDLPPLDDDDVHLAESIIFSSIDSRRDSCFSRRLESLFTVLLCSTLLVKIPRIDRTSTDFYRVPCVVVEVLGTTFHLYRVR